MIVNSPEIWLHLKLIVGTFFLNKQFFAFQILKFDSSSNNPHLGIIFLVFSILSKFLKLLEYYT